MEEIAEKAFNDEFNKAEDTIETKRDTTPLPKHKVVKKADKQEEETDEEE